ncbi:hypothetical protein evm_014644 [Chilo suppressalis]|nr:hypothetical protein evm_014644 [Chilo suppressalis]
MWVAHILLLNNSDSVNSTSGLNSSASWVQTHASVDQWWVSRRPIPPRCTPALRHTWLAECKPVAVMESYQGGLARDEAAETFNSKSQTIASNIKKISQNVSSMSKMVNQLQTPQDSQELRNQL